MRRGIAQQLHLIVVQAAPSLSTEDNRLRGKCGRCDVNKDANTREAEIGHAHDTDGSITAICGMYETAGVRT